MAFLDRVDELEVVVEKAAVLYGKASDSNNLF